MLSHPTSRMASIAILCMASLLPEICFGASTETQKHLEAVVIGNSQYNSEYLAGPDNDAVDVANELARIGFRIRNEQKITNLSLAQMSAAFDALFQHIDRQAVVVIYFSGHGLENSHKNFLIPTDASIEHYADVSMKTISLDWLIDELKAREAKTTIIILDACRTMPASIRYKSLGQTGGLSALLNLGPGMRVVYAASPDMPAMPAAKDSRNSVFTAALLSALTRTPSTFEDILTTAARLTREATGGLQQPWSTGTLGIDISGMVAPNPLSFTSNTKPATSESSRPSTFEKSQCRESEMISQQTVKNGVVTWEKICL